MVSGIVSEGMAQVIDDVSHPGDEPQDRTSEQLFLCISSFLLLHNL
ncbi:MAG: hypothetical protein OJF52_004007 [Nitrospira sp.]|jgi:hypothetical protein|nr:MAG: hypothetical protein OJF52_004007 [Nitrospira sp.]